MFPKNGELFHPLIADLEEVRTSVQYHQLNGKDTADLTIGNGWGFIKWTDNKRNEAQIDLSGVVSSRFFLSSNRNKLQDTDFIVNIPIEYRRNLSSYSRSRYASARLTFYHESSHAGDDYILDNTIQPRIYSREGIQLLGAYEPCQYARIYSGTSLVYHSIPNVGTVEIQGGFELFSPVFMKDSSHPIMLYYAHDLQIKEESNYDQNVNIQMGVEVTSKETRRKMKLFLNQYTGNSVLGQFYTREERFMSVGVSFVF